jgi:hypothetical protein
MPTLIDAGKTPHAGAPQPPGDVGRDVEVGKLLWIRGEARYGLGGFLSDRPAPASVPRSCQNGRKTAVISGRPRASRMTSDLGTRRLTPCLKRPSKQ